MERADKGYAGVPVAVRKALGKQMGFLPGDVGHPSLHAKQNGEALSVFWAAVPV